MKKKHLAVLGAIVLALLALRLVLGARGPEVARELADAGIVRLVPDDLDPADVHRVRVEPGEGVDSDPLVVERQDGGWRIVSAPGGGAPARSDAVESFLEGLAGLRGEPRADGASTFEEFGVGDDSPTVTLESADGARLLALRVGDEAGRPRTLFARRADEELVLAVRGTLRQDLGLWGESAAPPPDHWVDLEAISIDEATVERVRVRRPDATWTFERGPAGGAEADTEADTTESTRAEWRLVEPALPWPVRESAVPAQVTRLATVRAGGLLDPAEVPACDADGGASAAVELAGANGVLATYRVGPVAGDDVVLRAASPGPCWSLTTWSTRSLLPRVATLFDVPDAFPDAPPNDEIDRLTIRRDGETLNLRRSGDEGSWVLEDAEPGETVDVGRVTRLLGALRSLRADDLVSASTLPAAATAVEATIVAQPAQGERMSVELLTPRDAPGGGRLFRTSPGAAAPDGFVAVVAEATAQSLLADRAQLVGAE